MVESASAYNTMIYTFEIFCLKLCAQKQKNEISHLTPPLYPKEGTTEKFFSYGATSRVKKISTSDLSPGFLKGLWIFAPSPLFHLIQPAFLGSSTSPSLHFISVGCERGRAIGPHLMGFDGDKTGAARAGCSQGQTTAPGGPFDVLAPRLRGALATGILGGLWMRFRACGLQQGRTFLTSESTFNTIDMYQHLGVGNMGDRELDRQARLFDVYVEALIPEHSGKWVVFRGGAVVAFFEDINAALDAAFDAFGSDGSYVVAQVKHRGVIQMTPYWPVTSVSL